jgi:hypothetical protein
MWRTLLMRMRGGRALSLSEGGVHVGESADEGVWLGSVDDMRTTQSVKSVGFYENRRFWGDVSRPSAVEYAPVAAFAELFWTTEYHGS